MKKRTISTPALLFTSVSAIIGSGWLFAAYYAATTTGPAAILSWIFGALAMIVVAFTYAELSAFVPVTGASMRVLRYTHGQFTGFMFAWITWISYVAIMAIEVQAIIQYGSFFFPSWVYPSGGLTFIGYVFAAILMLLVAIINFYSLRWLLRCNNFLTVLKLIIPVVIAGAILVAQFPVSHDSLQQMTFAPQGLKGIFATITTGGIVFAFNGFRQATELAGEAKNPQRSLPIAVIGSVIICLIVYLCLQYSFLAAVATNSHLKDWQSLKLSGINSPFAIILTKENLNRFLPLLYLGAVAGPFAAALMYGSSGARALYAMSMNGSIPKWFAHLTPHGLPVRSIFFNFALGMCLFAPFPGWAAMASFLTSLMALTYISAPLCSLALTLHLPDHDRYFKLPYPKVWCFIAFYICNLLFYWTGWDILQKLLIMLIVGFIALVVYRWYSGKREQLLHLNWKASSWMWCFFIGQSIVSYYGSFGGKGTLPFGWDFLAFAVISLASLWLGIKFTRPVDKMQQDIESLIAEQHA
jgi:amino acid transporter